MDFSNNSWTFLIKKLCQANFANFEICAYVSVCAGKGKTIAGVSSKFYHRIFIIAVISSRFYHRSLIYHYNFITLKKIPLKDIYVGYWNHFMALCSTLLVLIQGKFLFFAAQIIYLPSQYLFWSIFWFSFSTKILT